MAAFGVEILDVGVERFGDAQPVHRQQRDQRVITRRAEAGLDEQGAELVAVQPECAGLVVDLGSAHVGRRSRATTPSAAQ